MGLAISKAYIEKGYKVIIVDQYEPESNVLLDESNFEYIHTDLFYFDEHLFRGLAEDNSIKVLMITAGCGRAAAFEYLHLAEIQKLMQVNATAGMQIISCFYSRLKEMEYFYCGIMVSITGMISSPLFSVYAASKAALFRFIESINIELEVNGTDNRILNISPASFQGSRFNGGSNELSQLKNLAAEIIERMFNREQLYIPQYEETFREVIDRYKKDPHEYGLHSYEYKMQSGRVFNERKL